MPKLLVQVDPDLSDLMPGFLANKRADADKILAAAAAADYAALRGIGHKIKGEGGSFGFDRISEIGAEVEQAAIDQDLAEIRRCGENLAAYLEAVEIVFE
ncbi:MAG TPA: Hpt domain-containing protein [Candidatus Binataceae bacterium]|nr:Hpt domain-containing protein [Candidatus Binataceae bacterium]